MLMNKKQEKTATESSFSGLKESKARSYWAVGWMTAENGILSV